MSQEKISAADIAELLETVPTLLRELSRENQALREKVAAFEQSDRAERLVLAMESRGHNVEGRSTQEKVSTLLRSGRDIAALEAAVDLMPVGGEAFSLSDLPAAGGAGAAGARATFEAAIMGQG